MDNAAALPTAPTFAHKLHSLTPPFERTWKSKTKFYRGDNYSDAGGVDAGDRIEFVQIEAGRSELIAATRAVRDLKGRFGKPGRTVTLEEMDAAIAAQAARAR